MPIDNTLLCDKYPNLEEQWSEKNQEYFSTIRLKSKKKYYWKCKTLQHEFFKEINSLINVKNENCETCKSLKFNYPHLSEMYSKNNEQKLEKVLANSNKEYLWYCKQCKGEFPRIVSNLVKNPQCPYCNNQKTLEGFNDLFTKNKGLEKYWDYTKNTLNPKELSGRSSKRAFFICENSHSFSRRINDFIDSHFACTYCKGAYYALTKENSFLHHYPEAKEMWLDTNTRRIETLTIYSPYKARLLCSRGHVFKRAISKIHQNSLECPICTYKIIIKGVNDLQTERGDLLEFWSPNNSLKMEELSVKTSRRVIWNCRKHGEYLRSPKDQSIKVLCYECFKENRDSEQQKELTKEISKNFIVLTNYSIEQNGLELDIFLPDLMKGIEFNGDYWHSKKSPNDKLRVKLYGSTENYHRFKKSYFEERGIEIIFVWESDWVKDSLLILDSIYDWLYSDTLTQEIFHKFSSDLDKND